MTYCFLVPFPCCGKLKFTPSNKRHIIRAYTLRVSLPFGRVFYQTDCYPFVSFDPLHQHLTISTMSPISYNIKDTLKYIVIMTCIVYVEPESSYVSIVTNQYNTHMTGSSIRQSVSLLPHSRSYLNMSPL